MLSLGCLQYRNIANKSPRTIAFQSETLKDFIIDAYQLYHAKSDEELLIFQASGAVVLG